MFQETSADREQNRPFSSRFCILAIVCAFYYFFFQRMFCQDGGSLEKTTLKFLSLHKFLHKLKTCFLLTKIIQVFICQFTHTHQLLIITENDIFDLSPTERIVFSAHTYELDGVELSLSREIGDPSMIGPSENCRWLTLVGKVKENSKSIVLSPPLRSMTTRNWTPCGQELNDILELSFSLFLKGERQAETVSTFFLLNSQ